MHRHQEMPMPFSFGNSPLHFAGDLETIAEVSLNVTLECKALGSVEKVPYTR